MAEEHKKRMDEMRAKLEEPDDYVAPPRKNSISSSSDESKKNMSKMKSKMSSRMSSMMSSQSGDEPKSMYELLKKKKIGEDSEEDDESVGAS